jgi:hypothetical protein
MWWCSVSWSVGASKPELDLARLARRDRRLQSGDDVGKIIRVGRIGRGPVPQFVKRPPEILRDLVVDEFDRSGVRQRADKGGNSTDGEEQTLVVAGNGVVCAGWLVALFREVPDSSPTRCHLRIIVPLDGSTRSSPIHRVSRDEVTSGCSSITIFTNLTNGSGDDACRAPASPVHPPDSV